MDSIAGPRAGRFLSQWMGSSGSMLREEGMCTLRLPWVISVHHWTYNLSLPECTSPIYFPGPAIRAPHPYEPNQSLIWPCTGTNQCLTQSHPSVPGAFYFESSLCDHEAELKLERSSKEKKALAHVLGSSAHWPLS